MCRKDVKTPLKKIVNRYNINLTDVDTNLMDSPSIACNELDEKIIDTENGCRRRTFSGRLIPDEVPM